MKDILKTYQNKITNLSATNKSLLHLKCQKQSDLDVHELDFTRGITSIKIVEKLLLGENVEICPIEDPRDEKSNILSKKIRKIYNRVNFIKNERGSEDLFVGYPFVEGCLQNGFGVRSPLMFIPVQITLKRNVWVLECSEERQIKINKSFLLAYSHYQQIKLDQALDNFDLRELEYTDLRSFLVALYELLKNSTLEINFNQKLFEETLTYFHDIKKSDFEASLKEGVLKLMPHSVLGIYPQAGTHLYTDYEDLLSKNIYDNLEELFSTKNVQNKTHREETFFVPFPIDSSQEKAIEFLKSGKSLVVQGPPGTGKSQLIAQVIADSIANGKKILLTCDKRVALDIVYQRLSTIALEDHLGIVHDFNADRKKIFEKIGRYIENLDITSQQNNRYESIAIERDFLHISRRIKEIEIQLQNLKAAIFDEGTFGISTKQLYLNTQKNASNPINENLQLKKTCKELNISQIDSLITRLNFWIKYAIKFESPNFSLKHRLSFYENQDVTVSKILNAYKDKAALQKEIFETSERLFERQFNLLEFELLIKENDEIINIGEKIVDEGDFNTILQYHKKKINHKKTEKAYKTLQTLLAKGQFLKLRLETLLKDKNIIDQAIFILDQFGGKIKFFFAFKEKQYLKSMAIRYNIKVGLTSLKSLKLLITNNIEMIEELTKFKNTGISIDYEDLLNIDEWFETQNVFCNTVDELNTLSPVFQKLWLNKPYIQFQNSLRLFSGISKSLSPRLNSIRLIIKDEGLNKIDDILDIEDSLKAEYESIKEFDRLTNQLSGLELDLGKYLLNEYFKTPSLNILDLKYLKNSIFQVWIQHNEEKHPILNSLSSGYIQTLEEELINLLNQKQKLSKKLVKQKAAEQTLNNLEYNRLGNRTSYRDLYHETTKKRKLLSLRQLFERYQNEILQIIPCWMASPETVSAVFPNKEIFDLVIFDEASQCFVEDGIPSLFRAKQVLVAGDSKQLSPNDLYRPRWEDEDESIDEQTHSFLDLCSRYLPQIMLCEHYRSSMPELIQFSNLKFYHNKLRSIPDAKRFFEYAKPLEYIKVEGTWLNQQNYLEAQECVNRTIVLLEEQPNKTIGIITFNFRQQELIQELLIEVSLVRNVSIPDTLFVKNIENVQGDERDIIIFSIGYAPNDKGKIVNNFGSLGISGGENRLNVAITRAKEKLIIVSSVFPQQLNTHNALNLGPILLKEYLQYAWDTTMGHHLSNENLKINGEENLNILKSSLKDMINAGEPHFVKGNHFADLIDVDNGKLIITDDELYFNSRSSKEIHGYLPIILNSKSWKVEKRYSKQWYDKN